MPLWLSIALPVAVTAATIAVNTFIAIKIKFAPDAAAATREIRTAGVRVLLWILNGFSVCAVLYFATRPGPVTGLTVFLMILCCSNLMLSLLTWALEKIRRVLDAQTELQTKQVEALKGIQANQVLQLEISKGLKGPSKRD